MKIVNFRVDDAEHQLMHAIAGASGMTLSGYIRQHFRVLAIENGLVQNPLDALRVHPETTGPKAKPAVERLPIPQGTNELRDAVYTRVNKGESLPDVAESYGIPLDVIKAMYKRAKESAESQSEAAPNHEIISKEVLNDPEQMRVINDAKFAALMANMQEKPQPLA